MRTSETRRLAAFGLAVLALAALGAPSTGSAQGAPAQKFVDPLRGATPIDETTRPGPLLGAENRDMRRVRSYAMQPPTIPHAIDNYQIDRFANRCVMCHARTRASDTQATPVSITHYTDRNGNFLADIAPRRYFCDTCHVVQIDAKPLVENTFEDVDTVVRRAQAQAKGKGAKAR